MDGSLRVSTSTERNDWIAPLRSAALAALKDGDAFVVRAAVDGLALHPDAVQLTPLIAAYAKASKDDVMLRYEILRALSSHVVALTDATIVRSLDLNENDAKLVASTLSRVQTPLS